MESYKSLNSEQFAGLIRSGYARLKEKAGVVNGLNIFPVPDGDTGTNMMLSLGAGIDALNRQCKIDGGLRLVAEAFISGLMMGARGNSGVILSQLFRGFQKTVQTKDAVDVASFAQALHEGVQIAYRAVAKPVEGTILTVAREAAMVGMREAKRINDLATWIEMVLAAADAALQKTPTQLDVLKQAGVVDSGGQGLVYIYEGFLRFLHGEPVTEESGGSQQVDEAIQVAFRIDDLHHDGEFGYCTEVLIRTSDNAETAQGKLRETLSRYGDSLLVVSNADLVKVHVHTLHPGRVLEDALHYGPLVKIKIDNMTEQNQAIERSGQPRTVSTEHSTVKAETETSLLSVVAVAAGDGLCDLFRSLGADVIVTGGQTMNPSTEEIVMAVRQANGAACIFLPNNKNIVLAAEQAREVLGDRLAVVPTTSIPAGIAAMMAYLPSKSITANVERMTQALDDVRAGQVVCAVRDSVYQDRPIRAGQFLGFVDQQLITVADDRCSAAVAVVDQMQSDDTEIITVFYGANVDQSELERLRAHVEDVYGADVETQFGGQPVYDYIFSME
jgi:uncharacterized protein